MQYEIEFPILGPDTYYPMEQEALPSSLQQHIKSIHPTMDELREKLRSQPKETHRSLVCYSIDLIAENWDSLSQNEIDLIANAFGVHGLQKISKNLDGRRTFLLAPDKDTRFRVTFCAGIAKFLFVRCSVCCPKDRALDSEIHKAFVSTGIWDPEDLSVSSSSPYGTFVEWRNRSSYFPWPTTIAEVCGPDAVLDDNYVCGTGRDDIYVLEECM